MKQVEITYTSKGFTQDADQAMEGDVIKGLIELITNADDAYGANKGKIRVTLRRPKNESDPTSISVSDQAKGLSPEGMENAFLTLGGETSGFLSGDDVRGLFGRGSKDTAWFGQTVFESIKDGEYSILSLNRDGKGTTDNRPATADDYKKLGVATGGNGLTATMRVSSNIAKVPDSQRVVQRLSSHFQLRDINLRHEVLFEEFLAEKRIQMVPIIWELVKGKVLLDEDLEIPEYKTSLHLHLVQLPDFMEGSVSEYSTNGIEVVGSRAAYMNTFFGLNGYGTGMLHGRVNATIIDKLIREFDKNESDGKITEENPHRLVRRDRKGLSEDHPLVKLFYARIIEKIKPIIESFQPKAEEAGSAQLRKELSQLARALNDLMREDLGESEGDDIIGPGSFLEAGPIVVIPPSVRGRLGSTRDLTILVDANSVAARGLIIELSNTLCSTVNSPVPPEAHELFDGVFISRARIQLNGLGSTKIFVRATEDPTLVGTSEVLVHDEPPSPDDPPSTLEWKNSSMSVAVGKTRSLLLRAPIELGPNGSIDVNVELDGDTATLLEHEVRLKLTKNGWLEGRIKVQGLKVGPIQKIIARCNKVSAVGRIKVGLPDARQGFNFEVKLEHAAQGSARGLVRESDTGRELVILTLHPGLSAYLGKRREDGSYTREQEPAAKAALVEAIASVASDFVLRKEVSADPAVYRDIDMIVQKRNQLVYRYIRPLLASIHG